MSTQSLIRQKSNGVLYPKSAMDIKAKTTSKFTITSGQCRVIYGVNGKTKSQTLKRGEFVKIPASASCIFENISSKSPCTYTETVKFTSPSPSSPPPSSSHHDTSLLTMTTEKKVTPRTSLPKTNSR